MQINICLLDSCCFQSFRDSCEPS